MVEPMKQPRVSGKFSSIPARVRFMEKVSVGEPDECWEWRGHLGKRGYGQFWLNGEVHAAHRAALLLHGSTVRTNDLVCHHCDNPRCVNVRHLFVGSMSDNIRDAVLKCRHPKTRITHCPKGHPYNAGNTYRDKDGKRYCRTCRALSSRRRAREVVERHR